ncbi:hypothetical protein SDC9_172492 [bioreactor metagenome]|uniref:Uncharacterized protein n=1 Tax=bioreactor metagenome TaxID=1076179 RepID=A0A645GEH4_9ZZZZ
MALFQLLKGVVRNGLHDLGAPLYGEAVYDAYLNLAGLYLICEQELHHPLGGCADVRAYAVSPADSDDHLVELGIIDPVPFLLQPLDSVQLFSQ